MFSPNEGKTRVFISYSKEDKDAIGYIESALRRNGFDPYISEWSPIAGEYISKKIANGILSSLNFVFLLTELSQHSQWMNQEVGFAFALKYLNEIQKDPVLLRRFPVINAIAKNAILPFNSIEIYPIVQMGIEPKGFIDKSIEYVLYDPSDYSSAAINLLPQIRTRVRESYGVKLKLYVKCDQCNHEMYFDLPREDEIYKAIENANVLQVQCENCKNDLYLEPLDFSIKRGH